MKKSIKLFTVISSGILILVAFCAVVYLKAIPYVVNNEKTINAIEKLANDSLKANLKIVNPVLKTHFTPEISFSVDSITITKNNKKIFDLNNFNTDFTLAKIFKKHIVIKKFGADYIFADVNSLMSLVKPDEQQKETKSDWFFDFFESLLYVKKCDISYKLDKNTNIFVSANNVEITDTRNPKFVHFNLDVALEKGKNKLKFAVNDNNKVYVNKRKFLIDQCPFYINKSKILMNVIADEENNFDFTFASKKFDLKDVITLIDTNLIIPNGSEILSYFNNINGNFDFNINITNTATNGYITLNSATAKIIPLNNLRVAANSGRIDIDPKNITLSNFKGWWGAKKSNVVTFEGTVNNYNKRPDTNISVRTAATNEFSEHYLSKIIGYPLQLKGRAPAKIICKAIDDKVDILIMAKIAKGDDLLADGASFSPVAFDRAVTADMEIIKDNLEIKSVNYYIAKELVRGVKVKPIVKISGNVICSNGKIKNLGFEIPKPLPSEFLNVLAGQKIFKKGTISGNMEYINTSAVPVLKGSLKAEGVRIPSQRMSVKYGEFAADNNGIKLVANGRYKRSMYSARGLIKNSLIFPIVVKNSNLTVDDVDIVRIMKSFSNQNAAANAASDNSAQKMVITSDKKNVNNENDNDAVTFNTAVLIVENCSLNVVKGSYKDIKFDNIKADLTLDKNGVLKVKSNKFNIAEGTSSLKVNCDLKKQLYSLVLGVKDINSDLMATTLLELPREISGKASGIISLNTDKTFRMNGFMKFAIKDGVIGKIGLIEYVLKFAALFRNPLAMISPSTLVDLVNIPEGNFDKISGDLLIKDNVIERIIIKSQAPQLSSLIAGRFDLEKRDATLRIYTKFSNKNKGLGGVLRNLSLNSLANRVTIGSRSDANYYSAELKFLPEIEADEKDCQIFITKVDGDVERNNFISSLKKIK